MLFEKQKSYYEITHNFMRKSYLDGSMQMIFANKKLFREPGWKDAELVTKNSKDERRLLISADEAEDAAARILEGESEARKAEDNLDRALRRARVKVRDYALCTPMRWFATLTLDQAKVDRYDVDAMTRRLNMWLNHLVTRSGLAYVMVPELHKDGAIHYHALMTNAVDAVDSGTIIPRGEDKPRRPRSEGQRQAWLRCGGRIVYNLPQWPYGYTTALEISGYYEAAVTYVSKYISKGHNLDRAPRKVGGRWYYHGGDLGRPEIAYDDVDFDVMRDAVGRAGHRVDVSDRLPGVEMIVVWVTPDGVLR